jgi:acetyl-CoA/propionyl-CoA carboxylase carboxyl transferase subunit
MNLFDGGEFTTITPEDDRGVLAAVGRANGTNIVAFCTDPTVQGGAMGNEGCRAIITAYDRAFADSSPVIGLWHSGGARLREGVLSLDGVGRVFGHGSADRRGARPSSRWRCLRSGAHRHRHHGARGPNLRHWP